KNFRDLGGIKTKDGKRVKYGLFYRSAALDDATCDDICFLKSLGLCEVFDYRDEGEGDASKQKVYGLIGAKHLHFPTNINDGKLFKLQNGGWTRAFVTVYDSDVEMFYKKLLLNNRGYAEMVKALVNGETPFLQHCTAGKDRAGTGCALLLTILGVDYNDIINDYLTSLEIKDFLSDIMTKEVPVWLKSKLKKKYEPLFEVKKSYLDAAFGEAIKKYGSIENYLEGEYGLTSDKLALIRAKYTE
ncbi:MAG: tyrosine-protein phosphatase, partial [Clostridia bacterium]